MQPGFAVAVKLNSADFQRGGFSSEDARRVVEMLNPLGVDLVELSGGSYEAPAMQGGAGGSPPLRLTVRLRAAHRGERGVRVGGDREVAH